MLCIPDWETRTSAALHWLRRSCEVVGFKGSAHSYSPLWGWAAAYPETTGYLVPTFLRYAGAKQDTTLYELAHRGIRWLETIQLPGGAFCRGLAGNTAPSAFNTAMILFGLAEMPARSLERASSWLLAILEPDGFWRQAAYLPGFTPSYYTYALWGLLTAQQKLQWPGVERRIRCALHAYAERFRSDGTVTDWGLKPGNTAYTHTIAYTLSGFLESGLLLQERKIVEQVFYSADRLLHEHRQAGRLAGRYSLNWAGDYRFRCLTGNVQLSVMFYRLWQVNGERKYKQAALEFLMETIPFQCLKKNGNTFGAIAGSAPFRGPYLRFRYPNWAAKFFLDALLPWQDEV